MNAALRAQIQHLQAELATRTAERDQARENFRKAFGIVQAIYTNTGVRHFVVSGTPYELDDRDPMLVLKQMRAILRGIPLQVQRMHDKSPEVPRPQWHPTVHAHLPTAPMDLDTRPMPYYPATAPASL